MPAVEHLTEDERFILTRWSMFGSDGYPVVKRGRNWFVDGIRGLGNFPSTFKTKKAAVERWELFIDHLIEKSKGNR